MSLDVEKYKKAIEGALSEMVCNKTIRNFTIGCDVDESGVLNVVANVILNSNISSCIIKESDFPWLSREEFISMCDEIREELKDK